VGPHRRSGSRLSCGRRWGQRAADRGGTQWIVRCAPRAPPEAAPACGLAAWPHHRVARPTGPRERMTALGHRSPRRRTGVAIPYQPYQLPRSRALTPVSWRKHALPMQLIQRYGIAVSECSIVWSWSGGGPRRQLDESAPGGPRSARYIDRSSAVATSACGHCPRPWVWRGASSPRPHRARRPAVRRGRAAARAVRVGHIIMWPVERSAVMRGDDLIMAGQLVWRRGAVPRGHDGSVRERWPHQRVATPYDPAAGRGSTIYCNERGHIIVWPDARRAT
jgi:hypothetical protein